MFPLRNKKNYLKTYLQYPLLLAALVNNHQHDDNPQNVVKNSTESNGLAVSALSLTELNAKT